jgi:hypothetical protein
MSSFVYGIVTAKRAAAPAGQSQTSAAPAMSTYVDTLAALIPAEALALYAGIVAPNVTNSVPVHGKTATVISDPKLLGWSCAGLLVLSSGLYVLGRFKTNAKRNLWDVPRSLIPPAAFLAWMLVQNPGVFDVWWPGSTTAEHVVIAAFAAIVLGVLASVLGYQADQAAPAPAVTGLYPANGPAAGGRRGGGCDGHHPGGDLGHFGSRPVHLRQRRHLIPRGWKAVYPLVPLAALGYANMTVAQIEAIAKADLTAAQLAALGG